MRTDKEIEEMLIEVVNNFSSDELLKNALDSIEIVTERLRDYETIRKLEQCACILAEVLDE